MTSEQIDALVQAVVDIAESVADAVCDQASIANHDDCDQWDISRAEYANTEALRRVRADATRRLMQAFSAVPQGDT